MEGLTRDPNSEKLDEHEALGLVVELADRLRARRVSYCHFKSNEALGRSLSGENDLDLLVARSDAQTFATALADLGFRVARPKADRVVPGVVDYYGLDEDSGRLVHVHAHYQLFLGDDTTKNYRLAVEGVYLASVDDTGILPVPSASFEFVLFVLRMVLKHSPFDAQLARKGKLTRSERRELSFLLERRKPEEVRRIVEHHLDLIDFGLFEEAARAVAGDLDRLSRAFVARRVAHGLRDSGRRAPGFDVALKVWRRLKWRLVSRLGGRRGKRLDRGGLFVAILGADGSGKSSAVAMLRSSLARHMETEVIHLGKPHRSRLTRVLKGLMGRARRRGWFASTRLDPTVDLSSMPFPGYGFLVWHLLTARDRYRTYRRARRESLSGTIVVSDRFPLPDLRTMDAPRTALVQGANGRVLVRWLISKEEDYYGRIRLPDLLVVLRVDPEIAVTRRSDQDAEFVRSRAQEVWERDWDMPNCIVIDANSPIEEVHTAVRRAVWSVM